MIYKIVTAEYDRAARIADELRAILVDHTESETDFEFLFIVGGDGTFAKQVRLHALIPNLKMIGIHGGHLGFFSSFTEKNLAGILAAITSADDPMNCYKTFHLIELELNNKKYYAFNDLVLFAESMLVCDLFLNQTFFENYRGSGLLIATKYGSSGYNKSAGGPLIFPEVQAWILNELFPQKVSNMDTINGPVILPLNTEITIDIYDDWRKSRISLDGFEISDALGPQLLKVRLINSLAKIFLPCYTSAYVEQLRRSFLINNHQKGDS